MDKAFAIDVRNVGNFYVLVHVYVGEIHTLENFI